MRAPIFAPALIVALAISYADAHGPQIQITNDSNEIVTRRLLFDGPYSDALTTPTSVYVMPILPFEGVWYSRPNGEIDPITHLPAFPNGPGLAYGYDLADGPPQAFAAGSTLSISFTDGLKFWDGAAFVDAGVTEAKAFRGTNPNITSPAANFAITSDSGPFDSVSLPNVASGYGSEGAEVHNTVRFAMLGDGSSTTSSTPDGVYLLSLQISSTQVGLNPSDEYFFVLHKNATTAAVADAVNSLGISPARVQFVPEPASALLLTVGLVGCLLAPVTRPRRAQCRP